ncbi:MAG: hypothetical protein EOP07_22580 [Proteobacteria bacterium]|nr:MAG: hypothetical protein EOP07_22580 [Pseudomonadota bacterium]
MWIDDQVLNECEQDLCIKTWIPQKPVVVLGRSNKRGTEADRERCDRDGIEILKRLGGGGTVILHEQCLVVSCGLWVKDYYKNDLYFKNLNQALIDVFQSQIPNADFTQRGYSDVVLGSKKLVGTSLFRSRNYLLYQASILVDPRIDLMETYLRHPSAEPDYRQGRSHRDFVMGLSELSAHSPKDWLDVFSQDLKAAIEKTMEGELLPSQTKQNEHVKSRMGEARELD